jgi:hypothetical protein
MKCFQLYLLLSDFYIVKNQFHAFTIGTAKMSI